METTKITEKVGLLAILDALRSAAEKVPEGASCCLCRDGIQLFRPDEGKISDIYGQEISQAPFDDTFDERFLFVGDVKVLWLVPKEADDEPTV